MKAKAGMVHSVSRCTGKTVRALENACHTCDHNKALYKSTLTLPNLMQHVEPITSNISGTFLVRIILSCIRFHTHFLCVNTGEKQVDLQVQHQHAKLTDFSSSILFVAS